MSTILRALKKLEHDKASRKPGPAEMDLEFLDSAPPAPRRSLLKRVLMVFLLVACGSVATYLIMAPTEKTSPPAQSPATRARQIALKPVTSASQATVPLANRSSAAAQRTVSATPAQAEHRTPPPPLTAKPLQAIPKAPPVLLSKTTPIMKQLSPQTAKTSKPSLEKTPLPSLTVNGLALSDGEKRKAIVNGMSVSVGSVIEGARVEEILENRVRFSHGGKTFEISVGNTGP